MKRRLLVGGWCARGSAPGVVQAAGQKVMPYLRLIAGERGGEKREP